MYLQHSRHVAYVWYGLSVYYHFLMEVVPRLLQVLDLVLQDPEVSASRF